MIRRIPSIATQRPDAPFPVLGGCDWSSGCGLPHAPTSTSLPMSTLPSLPVTAMTTRIASANGFNPSFLIGFIVGGIICSSALSVVLAFGALGRENVSRAWDVARSVFFRVWMKFTAGLAMARRALVKGGGRWRFRRAWAVLREQLALTRESAVDGIEAIKLEASLYSGVVGKLGFPLAQYLVDNLSPKLGAFLAKQNLINALANIKNKNIRRITLEEFDFGTKGPTLISARTYDLRDDNAMAFDIDLVWESELEATIKVTPKLMGLNRRTSIIAAPVKLKNCRFEGVVRVVLTPLIDEPPGFLVVGPVTCRSYCCPTTSQQNHHTTSQIRLLCIQFFICTCGILQIYVSPFRISCDGFQRISGERKFQKKEWPGSSKRGRRPRRRHGQSSVTQGG